MNDMTSFIAQFVKVQCFNFIAQLTVDNIVGHLCSLNGHVFNGVKADKMED
jgi:hypothetical protein